MAKEKVCLAYSGGLDTSIILAWLIEQGYEVVCFSADVGQNEDWKAAEQKALKIGATKLVVEDLQREFVDEILWRAVQCNAIWEDRYLLGTSLARPVIARAQMRVAQREGCVAVSHGCTGKGNDQVRFELAFYAIQPSIRVIAPWRLPEFFNRFAGRNDLLDYAAKMDIPVTSTKAKPWSMDENLAHCSYEAGILEDPDHTPPEDMWKMTDSPLKAPDTPEDFTIAFSQGLPSKLVLPSGKTVTDSVEIFLALNALGRKHGVGRIDIVENRYIGLKSRGCYDSPTMTILRLAHLDLEGLVMDREVRALRDQFVTFTWSKLLYNGLYFSPEREFIEKSIVASQDRVNGSVRLRVYKGSASVLGRSSDTEKLYSAEESSMDTLEDFSPVDTTGFIGIQAIRLKKYGLMKEESGEKLSRA
ncbi:argininosuccinate synthase [Xylona heveae TC161]|uniref:Argininosuccinate synthase n=1 Tax=Xylona heveae (strain CBS 132557 / TC161) TaxID=1328760 RepID=A0A165J7W8_XYLHT|nr:argininosuccinate synthase [Xylona heveae TC161]KZF25866.1 argininosuccinate synthase [Xylona heveae TC161]